MQISFYSTYRLSEQKSRKQVHLTCVIDANFFLQYLQVEWTEVSQTGPSNLSY